MDKMTKGCLVVGIAGCTCSGKSTLAEKLHERITKSVLVKQDLYFLPEDDPRHKRIPELNHINWDILSAIDMPKMVSDVKKLVAFLRENGCEYTSVRRILILDGFLLFSCKELAELCDLRYFFELTEEQCWERRKNRIYDPPDVPHYFQMVAWPEYLRVRDEIHREPSLAESTVFIDGSRKTEDIYSEVMRDIRSLLRLK